MKYKSGYIETGHTVTMGRWKRYISCMTVFEWFEVLAVTCFTICFAAIDSEHTAKYLTVSCIAAICGILGMVLCASGKKAQYYWRGISVIAYMIVAWLGKYYGEVMLNFLYYLPSQLVGLYLWSTHYDMESGKVRTKEMKTINLVLCILFSIVCIWLYQIFLVRLGGKETWLDSTSTIFAIIANALMVLRYREQWVLDIIVNICTVILWIMAGNWIMTTMWAVYLINACHGLYIWTKMGKATGTASL